MSDRQRYSEEWVKENIPEATAELNKLSKRRSVPHANRYFAVLDKVWFHLHEDWVKRFFKNKHRMRKWLMVQCGYSKTTGQMAKEEINQEADDFFRIPNSADEEQELTVTVGQLRQFCQNIAFTFMKQSAGRTDDVFVVRDKEGTVSHVKADSQKFNRQCQKDFYECEKAMNDQIEYWFQINVDEMLANEETTP